jgi:hypothetical protein
MIGSVLESKDGRTIEWQRRIQRFFKYKTNKAVFHNVDIKCTDSFTFSAKIFYCYPSVTLGTGIEARIRAVTKHDSIPESAGCFMFSKTSRPGLGSDQSLIQWVLDLFPGGLSGWEMKLTAHLPSCAEFKNVRINISTLPNAFTMCKGTIFLPLLNHLTLNGHFSGRTAPLTYRCSIFYLFSSYTFWIF